MGLQRPTIVVGGAVAQRPEVGGHAWVYLQYLLGFQRLGYDVTFLDRLVGSDGGGSSYLRRMLAAADLEASYSLLGPDGSVVAGLSRATIVARLRRSVAFVNVMGYIEDPELLHAASNRVFLDIDPGFGHLWDDLDLHHPFVDHHHYVTVGLNIGLAGCPVPTGGVDWIHTLPPVLLDRWPARPLDPGAPFTAVGAWRGPFDPIDWHGHRYGLRVHEFRHLVDLPRRTGQSFHLAFDLDPDDEPDRQLLLEHGWHLVDPVAAAGTPGRYRAFLQGSAAELLVAKSLYVELRTGWVSDRSACYLASGRPVVAQDTGLAEHLPLGKGFLTFSTADEAAEAVEEISRDNAGHAAAARRLAEEVFDSDRVLSDLLDRVGAHG